MEVLLDDGTRIHCHDRGHGETLVFLHGNMEDGSFFAEQLEYFSKKYRVLAIDTRGHGKSDMGKGRCGLPEFSRDVVEVLEKLKAGRYTLIGFSDGANIAMELGAGKASGLECLVLVGGNLRPTGMKFIALLEVLLEYLITAVKAVWSKEGRKKLKILGLMLFQPRIKIESLKEIKVPTLVLAGEHDLIKEKETRRIASLIHGSSLIIVPGADHFLPYNESAKFNKIIEDYFNNANSV